MSATIGENGCDDRGGCLTIEEVVFGDRGGCVCRLWMMSSTLEDVFVVEEVFSDRGGSL